MNELYERRVDLEWKDSVQNLTMNSTEMKLSSVKCFIDSGVGYAEINLKLDHTTIPVCFDLFRGQTTSTITTKMTEEEQFIIIRSLIEGIVSVVILTVVVHYVTKIYLSDWAISK